jgi:hypothetical protein
MSMKYFNHINLPLVPLLLPSLFPLVSPLNNHPIIYLCQVHFVLGLYSSFLKLFQVFFIHLSICTYTVWAISPHPPRFQAEPILPFSPILMKRKHKQ